MRVVPGERNIFFITLVLSFAVAVLLLAATWDIQFWPTDAEVYYLEAAVKIPFVKYISQIHEGIDEARVKWLHGKEMLILNISIAQRLLKDFETLRPAILICILALGLSAALVFLLIRKYWGSRIGFLCFFLFLTSFWPYVYVLMVKHQPVGLCYFLLALFFMCCAEKVAKKELCYFVSGFFLCSSFFASTIAALYLSFFVTAAVYELYRLKRREKPSRKNFIFIFVSFFLGFVIPFIYFTYPNILYNLKSYWEYAKISSTHNHFYYNQPVLIQWVAHPELSPRGGWEWVVKYFFLVMPVIFPLYILSVLYLAGRALKALKEDPKSALIILGLILLSFSSTLLAEIKGVAQYGANYFSSFVGFIMLIGYGTHCFLKSPWYNGAAFYSKKAAWIILGTVVLLHAFINFRIFFTDVFPARMATTYL